MGKMLFSVFMFFLGLFLSAETKGQDVHHPQKTILVDDSLNIKSDVDSTMNISGKASFYGSEFNGRKTANGEVYDETAMTAAHRTLPFGTVLRVTNLRNGLSVIVRINDRGPFHPERILDLSKAAAEEIDLIHHGVTEIQAEIVD